MKWWFSEKAVIPTSLSGTEVMDRIRTIARPRHGVIDTLNPDHQFTDNYKIYVGTLTEKSFRVKRSYYSIGTRGRSQSIGLVVIGQVEDGPKGAVLYLRFTVPAINLLWLLFPPLWMLLFGAYAADYGLFHGVPVFTLLALLLLFYLFWIVLAQFRRHAGQAQADFELALQGNTSNFFFSATGFKW